MTEQEIIKAHLAPSSDIITKNGVVLGYGLNRNENLNKYPDVCIVCREKGTYQNKFWSFFNFSLCEEHKNYTFPFGGHTFGAFTPKGEFVEVNLF